MLFVNSIANTCLSHEDVANILTARLARAAATVMVVEITEEEAIDYEALEKKRNAPGFSGMFALDDYGSGYSNEQYVYSQLVAPTLSRWISPSSGASIPRRTSSRSCVKDVVAYAHPRSMKIVAEGIETEAELRKVIELGVDLLQGYFLAKPAASPSEIAPQALSVIRWMNR